MTGHRTLRRPLAAILITLGLVGCVTQPLISDVETDKVIIQAEDRGDSATVQEKAREGCAIHGRTPRYVSTRENAVSDGLYSYHLHLFACVQ